MTRETLEQLIFACGVGHFGILVASALVPFRLEWKKELGGLSRLHRQMYWTYGGYVVLSIIAFALISVTNAKQLAAGGGLARGFCAYVAIFWGVRVCLQAVFDVKEHLTAWWLVAGYHGLTAMFVAFTVVFAWAAVGVG